MGPAQVARVLLYAEDSTALEDVHRLLDGAGQAVGTRQWTRADPPPDIDHYHLIVFQGSPAGTNILRWARSLRERRADLFIPLLSVAPDETPAARLAGFEAGADACLPRPFTPTELLAQVQALLRIKERHDRLQEKAADMHHTNKRLQQAHQRVDQELELARRVQLSFLPQTLPSVPGARFAVHYRPCGRVGGDFYDVFRLDEHHVGFYVADAMGHGVPASLLTMFLKKGVRAKEIFHQEYRLVPPEEVLQHLNHELLEQGIIENSFITMVYGLFNNRDGLLHFARAGHPHPVFVPSGRDPEMWEVPGSLLGVFETKFSTQVCKLLPGDKALFYTDGTDAVSYEGHPAGTASFMACVQRHRGLSVSELVDRLAGDLSHQADQPDDFTLLGLEV
jgi:serine phosphatase RsbU (regulator of sigma subunit)